MSLVNTTSTLSPATSAGALKRKSAHVVVFVTSTVPITCWLMRTTMTGPTPSNRLPLARTVSPVLGLALALGTVRSVRTGLGAAASAEAVGGRVSSSVKDAGSPPPQAASRAGTSAARAQRGRRDRQEAIVVSG